MATTEDQKEIPENSENPENQENPEEEKEEEEPVDLELQQEMKGIKIDDSDFSNQPKIKKTNKKSKNPEEKKAKKKGLHKLLIPVINLIISDKKLFNRIIINVQPQNL